MMLFTSSFIRYMLAHKTKKLSNGNAALYYQMRDPLENPVIPICIGILFGSLGLAEYLLNATIYSFGPLLILFFFLFVVWAYYPCRYNEKLEEWWMNKNISLRLHNTLRLYDNDVHEVKRKMFIVSEGTYGVVKAKYMLVLLSNGVVLEYELKYHRASDGNESYHELLRRPQVCTDLERIRSIKGWSFVEWWKKNIYTEHNRSIAWIIFFLSVSLGMSLLGYWLLITLKETIASVLFFYIVVFAICGHFIGSSKNIVLRIVYFIVCIPFLILGIWAGLAHPMMIIIGSFLFTALFAFGVPAIIIVGIELIMDWEVNTATLIFCTLSVGSITCVFSSRIVHWFIKNYSPLKNWGNHKYEKIGEDLSIYLLDPSNINYLIYLAYFLYLSLSGFMHFQNNMPLLSLEYDEAVLKAFLVFIAYSNVVKHYKSTRFDGKTFVGKVFELITTHDN